MESKGSRVDVRFLGSRRSTRSSLRVALARAGGAYRSTDVHRTGNRLIRNKIDDGEISTKDRGFINQDGFSQH